MSIKILGVKQDEGFIITAAAELHRMDTESRLSQAFEDTLRTPGYSVFPVGLRRAKA